MGNCGTGAVRGIAVPNRKWKFGTALKQNSKPNFRTTSQLLFNKIRTANHNLGRYCSTVNRTKFWAPCIPLEIPIGLSPTLYYVLHVKFTVSPIIFFSIIIHAYARTCSCCSPVRQCKIFDVSRTSYWVSLWFGPPLPLLYTTLIATLYSLPTWELSLKNYRRGLVTKEYDRVG